MAGTGAPYVALMLANNETGVVHPVAEAAEHREAARRLPVLRRRAGAWAHSGRHPRARRRFPRSFGAQDRRTAGRGRACPCRRERAAGAASERAAGRNADGAPAPKTSRQWPGSALRRGLRRTIFQRVRGLRRFATSSSGRSSPSRRRRASSERAPSGFPTRRSSPLPGLQPRPRSSRSTLRGSRSRPARPARPARSRRATWWRRWGRERRSRAARSASASPPPRTRRMLQAFIVAWRGIHARMRQSRAA